MIPRGLLLLGILNFKLVSIAKRIIGYSQLNSKKNSFTHCNENLLCDFH